MKTRTITLTMTIGTLAEIGMGGLKQPWIDADGRHGNQLSLTVGAGLGNPLLEASSTRSKKLPNVYAKIDGRELGQQVFTLLEAEATGKLADEPEGETTQELAKRLHDVLADDLEQQDMTLTELSFVLADTALNGGR